MVQRYHLHKPIYIGDTIGDRDASQAADVKFGFASYGFGDLHEELDFPELNDIVEYFL